MDANNCQDECPQQPEEPEQQQPAQQDPLDLVEVEEAIHALTRLLEEGSGDSDAHLQQELSKTLELCHEKLQQMVERSFHGRSEQICSFLHELTQAPFRGEQYCRIPSDDQLQDVVQKLLEIGIVELSPEDSDLIRIAL